MEIGLIPNFITAKSLTGLRTKMLQNNLKAKTWFKYFDMQESTDRRNNKIYIAWYYRDIKDDLNG